MCWRVCKEESGGNCAQKAAVWLFKVAAGLKKDKVSGESNYEGR